MAGQGGTSMVQLTVAIDVDSEDGRHSDDDGRSVAAKAVAVTEKGSSKQGKRKRAAARSDKHRGVARGPWLAVVGNSGGRRLRGCRRRCR
ncbi:hypothetical protein GW17_00056292 [Ensete ventricosum]|nr:hypothetical protein GW17_00056292 [Ensete ventricosum]